MNVIIVGCGRGGAELAFLLSGRGHDVTVIDHVGSSFGHLDPACRGRTIEAEPLAEGVLEKAGVREAQAVATVTNSGAVNAVVAPTSPARSTACRTWWPGTTTRAGWSSARRWGSSR
jgi:trk system potassium uptake protein TrkA